MYGHSTNSPKDRSTPVDRDAGTDAPPEDTGRVWKVAESRGGPTWRARACEVTRLSYSSPTRRSMSWKRGSARSGSALGVTFSCHMMLDRSSYARSSQVKA